jgi:hypothetical protein
MLPLLNLSTSELRILSQLDGLVDALVRLVRAGRSPAFVGVRQERGGTPSFALRVVGVGDEGTVTRPVVFEVPDDDVRAAAVVARLMLRGLRADLAADLRAMAQRVGRDPIDAGFVPEAAPRGQPN